MFHFHNIQKNSSHQLRSSSLIGIDTNTQFGGCDFLDMGKNFKDLTGRVFGKLTVIKLGSRKSKNRSLYWLCKCECGTIKEIRGDGLVSKNVISCGCSKVVGMSLRFFRHGKIKTKAYGSWREMNARCFNENEEQYKDYGGRGITVCDRWQGLNGFNNFYADMGERPKNLLLERIDNNGNYEPSNCRWATRKEQQRNRRNNVWLEVFGERKVLKDWAIYLNVNPQTIRYHLNKNISMEEIYTYIKSDKFNRIKS